MATNDQHAPVYIGDARPIRAQRAGCRRLGAAIATLIFIAFAGSSILYGAGPVHTNRKYWIGKNISQAEKEFGTPTSSEQLIETGGMLVIYARKKDPVHFVFETDSGGTIVKAARVE